MNFYYEGCEHQVFTIYNTASRCKQLKFILTPKSICFRQHLGFLFCFGFGFLFFVAKPHLHQLLLQTKDFCFKADMQHYCCRLELIQKAVINVLARAGNCQLTEYWPSMHRPRVQCPSPKGKSLKYTCAHMHTHLCFNCEKLFSLGRNDQKKSVALTPRGRLSSCQQATYLE